MRWEIRTCDSISITIGAWSRQREVTGRRGDPPRRAQCPDTTIAADYALTERSFASALAWASEHEPGWADWLSRAAPSGLLDSPADVMIDFLALLRAATGTVDNHLTDAGLQPDAVSALRDRYVV